MYLPQYIHDLHGIVFPTNPFERQLFYRDDLHQLYYWNGTGWVASGGVVLPHHLTHELGGADQVMGTVPATPLALIHRDAAGRSQIANPAINADIDNLGSRNVAVAAEAAARAAADVAEAAARVAADAAHAAQTALGIHGSAVLPTPNLLVHRDAAGRSQIVNPTIAAEIDNMGARDAAIAAEAAARAAADAAEAAARIAGDAAEAAARAAADAAHAVLTTGVHGLKGEVSFEVYRAANQSIPNTTNTKVAYDTVVEDTHSYWDGVNYRHTPGIAGKYLYISCTQLWQVADATMIYVMLFKNGVFYSFVGRFRVGGISSLAVQGSKAVSMNGSTDYVEVWVFHNHGAARDLKGGPERNWLQGILLAQT